MGWTVSSAPASEPISSTEAKLWLKVDDTADDNLIDSLRKSARTHVERYTNTALLTQTIVEKFDQFPDATDENPDQILKLSVSPVQSITSITYTDADGDSQTLAASKYVVDTSSQPCRIGLAFNQTWPDTYDEIDAVTVTYVAGYTATTDANFPAHLLDAMYLYLSALYENRQDHVKRLKSAAEILMDQERVFEF